MPLVDSGGGGRIRGPCTSGQALGLGPGTAARFQARPPWGREADALRVLPGQAQGGPGSTAQLGPRGGRPSGQGERAGRVLRAGLLWKTPGGYHLPVSTPRQRGQGLSTWAWMPRVSGQRPEGEAGVGTALGWGERGAPERRGHSQAFPFRQARSTSCSLCRVGRTPRGPALPGGRSGGQGPALQAWRQFSPQATKHCLPPPVASPQCGG